MKPEEQLGLRTSVPGQAGPAQAAQGRGGGCSVPEERTEAETLDRGSTHPPSEPPHQDPPTGMSQEWVYVFKCLGENTRTFHTVGNSYSRLHAST